ncbi:Nectin-3 [Manis pentadactyla]|nr:Nectin-3 [Manis pentadactyla]
MYFFLKNLSLLDVFLVSVLIPEFIVNNLTHNTSISILGCAFQVLLMNSFSAGEIFVLTAMSYDRYVAICCHLHYEVLMSGGTCALLAGVCWDMGGVFFRAVYTASTFFMPFCGSSVIPQFFCDVSSLLRMSCSETPMLVLSTIKDDTMGMIIASVVGGALFIVLISVLAGNTYKTYGGDYFAKNYTPPSDTQKKKSQIDVLQQDELESYPDSVKKENKNPVSNLVRKDYVEESEKTQWNNVENLSKFERPMDYYEDLKMGMQFVSDEHYDENEDNLVSNVDGSIISRREWYV